VVDPGTDGNLHGLRPRDRRPPRNSRRLRSLTAATRDYFKCDEQFIPGHRDVCKQLFTIELIDAGDEEAAPTISLHALTGIQPRSSRTMQVMVLINGTHLSTLLDSGSTHNFVDSTTATQAGLALTKQSSLHVAVGNGDRVPSPGCCRDLHISIGGEPFSINCYSLDLGSFDMVLGVQWLESLGPILWDFGKRTITFIRNGHRVLWIAAATSPRALLHAVSPDLMAELLHEFEPLFAEPTGLPPQRSRCHRIRPFLDTAPVPVRPYRYAHAQKTELERQCNDMLRQGIIKHSSSAFSTSVVLIKKADSSWRFCVDYRVLNARTIKDKFPIPVVEELFDELHHARFFTKLDLCSGYHQVLMHPNDIPYTPGAL
jgi:hypothetical protein